MDFKIDTKTGERFRNSVEDLALNLRDFSLSFMPEATQSHVISMNREALLTAQSLINSGLSVLDRQAKKSESKS